jgi:hypothetical protein
MKLSCFCWDLARCRLLDFLSEAEASGKVAAGHGGKHPTASAIPPRPTSAGNVIDCPRKPGACAISVSTSACCAS